MSLAPLNRREFLGSAATASGLLAAATAGVSIVIDPADRVASAAPVRTAATDLRTALSAAGVAARLCASLSEAGAGDLCVLAAAAGSADAARILKPAGVAVPAGPEVVALAEGRIDNRTVLLASGNDARGLMYALLELVDRVENSADPVAALGVPRPIVEKPANRIRAIARAFSSDIEDPPWFNDRAMWPKYFRMLAMSRFNRFNLTLGLAYDFARNISDCYLHFAYPFLAAVPGYSVRATGLKDSERDANLAMLRFITSEAARHGLDFQLGLWTHAYQWQDSPNAHYTIEGLDAANHAAYCRDALALLLKHCPAITGVNFRVHGESGVAEGSLDFWRTVFDAVKKCGRRVEIDMHAKGIDQQMIQVALATGQRVVISPKRWAEHFGLPYHQAAIREIEKPRPGRQGSGLFTLSSGARSFLRYGYGDLLAEDRKFGVLHRLWPGTQRHLLWGDPLFAAAYSRSSSFCGSDGMEIQEPLFFKGRRGSGQPGGRCGYADKTLNPHWDWEKFLYTYRVWGRALYTPETNPEVWRRYLRKQFEAAAPAVEAALASASRILPAYTTTQGASAAHNSYWVEMCANMPFTEAQKHPYSDTDAPRVFGNVSPFDPQLFSRINEYADQLLKGAPAGKYSPVEVAAWIEGWAEAAAGQLAEAEKLGKPAPELRRFAADTAIQIGLGRFFSAKLRAGVLYALHERTGDRGALEAALQSYRSARAAWAEMAGRAKEVYVADLSYGGEPFLRGHWLDRLPAIDADIADLEQRLATAQPAADPARVRAAMREALGKPKRPDLPCRHTPADRFVPGTALAIELALAQAATVRLWYRRVNQAENYASVQMEARGGTYVASIPAAYTQPVYPLEYYFEIVTEGTASLYPGLGPDLTGQPYFVVRRG